MKKIRNTFVALVLALAMTCTFTPKKAGAVSDFLLVLGLTSVACLATTVLNTFLGTVQATFDKKEIIERADNELSLFIASDGEQRGAFLDNVLLGARSLLQEKGFEDLAQDMSDLELAKAVVLNNAVANGTL